MVKTFKISIAFIVAGLLSTPSSAFALDYKSDFEWEGSANGQEFVSIKGVEVRVSRAGFLRLEKDSVTEFCYQRGYNSGSSTKSKDTDRDLASWDGYDWDVRSGGKYSKQTLCVGKRRERPQCRNGRSIMTAAHELDREARQFADEVDRVRGYSHLYDVVISLAEEADAFYQTIESGEHCSRIDEDFDYVLSSWRRLMRKWRRAHEDHRDRRLGRDFRALKDSFRNLTDEVDSFVN